MLQKEQTGGANQGKEDQGPLFVGGAESAVFFFFLGCQECCFLGAL
jgi:hypothetical protein